LVPLCGPSARLVGPDAGAIDSVAWPIARARGRGLQLESGHEAREDASVLPPGEAAGHRAPGGIVRRDTPPRGAGAQDSSQAVEEAAVVMGRAPSGGLGVRLEAAPRVHGAHLLGAEHSVPYRGEPKLHTRPSLQPSKPTDNS
jgi:hypothetical protein